VKPTKQQAETANEPDATVGKEISTV